MFFMQRVVITSILLLACGCSVAEQADPVPVFEEPACGMAFDVPDDVLPEAERAAQRWSAATGCDVRIEEGGIPFFSYDQLFGYESDGELYFSSQAGEFRLCGLSLPGEWTVVGPCTVDMELTSLHEMGHHLGGEGHAADGGAMAYGTTHVRNIINSDTLTWVCEDFPCASFNPEQLP
jgi:hypothetical protein